MRTILPRRILARMVFERIEDPGLSQHSYLIGCPAAGEAALVDPRRDVEVYLERAAQAGIRIAHVIETHIHADFASGARALAEATGAELRVSGLDAGERYQASFPHRDIRDGEEIEVGSVRLVARHTPGHTPEHLAFLVYDTTRSADVPMLFLTGDFLFVGSVGRPDLLGEEAKRGLARRLYRSVAALSDLPDGLEVHPGHGPGSMCGAGMSGRPVSTLGFERLANPYLDPALDEAAFAEKLLAFAPPFPPYYRRMKELNAAGPVAPDLRRGRHPLGIEEFRQALDGGAVAVDVRSPLAFGRGHVPGSFGIGLGRNLSTWAAWVVPYDTPILLVIGDPADVGPAVRALVRVGLDDVRGHLEGGVDAWQRAGEPVATLPQTTPGELHEALASGEEVIVLDVRSDGEWRSGHIAGAVHVMGGLLPERLDEVPGDGRPIAVICGSGYRSTVAASVLERAGRTHLRSVTGGMSAWKSAGLPVTTD